MQVTADILKGLSLEHIRSFQQVADTGGFRAAAQKMNVSTSTVQSNVRNIYRKLEVNSRMHAVSKAKDSGLL